VQRTLSGARQPDNTAPAPPSNEKAMQFTGRYKIAAPPEAVWEALNDPAVLKDCISGCQSLEKTDANTFSGAAKFKIGPVSATFKGKVELTDLNPPRGCLLRGEGQGGVAGFAKGKSEVVLTAEELGTVLSYTAKATVGGKLAQVGQRLLDSAARQIADDFFSRFTARVTTQQTIPTPSDPHRALSLPQGLQDPTDGPPPVREGMAPEIWVIGLIAVIVILLILFGLVL
jgi:carbon monoxide dehydrogenase subunit G